MKNIYSVLALVLFFVSGILCAQSQNPNNQENIETSVKKHSFWYGPKAGLDLLTPTVNQDEIKAQLKSNYQAGMFFQFGRKIYLQPEFYYAVVTENRFFTNGLTTEDVSVNSLKIPVLLGIKLIDIGLVSAHIMGGPMGTFLLNESKNDSEIIRPKRDYKLQLGGGVDLLGFVTLDIRYAVNLDDNVKEELNQLTWNSGVNVTLGLKFR